MQQSTISYDLVLEQSLFFLVILVVCFIGAYAKDTFDTITGKSSDIQYRKVVFSSLVVAIIMWGFQDLLSSRLGGFKQLVAMAVFMGLISYDLTTRLSEWEVVRKVLSVAGVKLLESLKESISDTPKKDDDDKKDDNN